MKSIDECFAPDIFLSCSSRQILAGPNRSHCCPSQINKFVLVLALLRHFRLGEDRAVAQEETTAARCGLSSAREGRTKGIYDVHLSSLYLLSFLFPLPYSLSLSLLSLGQCHPTFPCFIAPLSRLSTSFPLVCLYHICLAICRFTLHLFARILSRVERRKSYKCILGWPFEEFGRGSSAGEKN